jgi:hypothetical protein
MTASSARQKDRVFLRQESAEDGHGENESDNFASVPTTKPALSIFS